MFGADFGQCRNVIGNVAAANQRPDLRKNIFQQTVIELGTQRPASRCNKGAGKAPFKDSEFI
jgi:hypothetical protein